MAYTPFNTDNPIGAWGSVDPRDLVDNAAILDRWVNDRTNTQWRDRFGVQRMTWNGMEVAFDQAQNARQAEFDADQAERQLEFDDAQAEHQGEFNADQNSRSEEFDAAMNGWQNDVDAFLASSGFELPWLEYVDGIPLVVERPTQIIERDGNIYSVKLPVEFPVTLTGAWASDELLLVLREDQALRQDLAESSGSDMVGWSRQELSDAISNVHQFLDSHSISVWEYAGLVIDRPSPLPSSWDWTTAINQAYVDAKAAGGEVVFPSGIYLVKDTVEVRTHSRFIGGACIEFTGFAADKAVINLGLDARNCRHYDLWVRNRDYNGDVSSCKGRGIVISSDPSNVNNFGAYNQILINPRIDYCDTGLVVRSFQEVIICPQIASCRCGIAIAGTSGSNESGVISFESGQVRDCFEYCVYIGDPSILPVTTNNINGVSISFKNTQLIGTFRATKASSIGLYNCNFECAGFGNGTAVQLDDDLYSILIDNPYFSAYEYGVRCTAQISALTIRNPTYYKNTKCGLYVFSAQAPFVYENPAYLGGNFTLAPELHIGLPQISATDVDFSLISVRMNGFVVNGGQQMSTKKPAKALHSAQYSLNGVRWVSVTSPNGSTPGICYEMPTVNIAGSLNSFIFTFNNPADAKYFAAGDSITCNAGGSTYGLVTRVDYEAGTMRLSGPFAASPTAGSVSQNTTSWEIPLRRGAFTWNAGTSTVTINDIAVKALSAIVLTPTNSAAAALMAGSSAPFVSNRTADTNFVLSTADGSNLAATATFGYAVINRI